MSSKIIFPAEWYPQSAVQLTWPTAQTDWKPILGEVTDCYVAIAREVVKREKLIIVCNQERDVRRKLGKDFDYDRVVFVNNTSINDTWARDHGGITVLIDGKPVVYDFLFNGWGMKFPADKDNLITDHIRSSRIFAANVRLKPMYPFVLEGGSIDSDGQGRILTTTNCLLSPNRNRHLSENEILKHLKNIFGLEEILTLAGELKGDDTDGHIDTMARFCDERTIAYIKCENEGHEDFHTCRNIELRLQEFRTASDEPYRLIPLPVADDFSWKGVLRPATYANFLVINGAVLVPFYMTDKDEIAREALQKAFPDREVTGIDCRPLIKQNGSLHCITMQYPKEVIL
jgi:agmatine/peptidylarginine deiminase